ncbi:MAG: dihydroxyacetone kinase subunit DhaK [Chloroflexota bacterium]
MLVQKIINRPEDFVDEMLDGVLLAHAAQLKRAGDPRTVVRTVAPIRGKVGIATGGGSGHLPVFLGYVGEGLADGVAVGGVFASPSAEQMLEVTRAINGGSGVLYLYGNYGGDVMNFDLAAELAAAEGIEVATVLGGDDVASAAKGQEARRRGIAGMFFLYKTAGARAAERATLAEVKAAAAKASANTRSMGVALSPCVLPEAGVPTFQLADGDMEIGMGIHGEPGIRRGKLEPADRIAEQLTEAIVDDLDIRRGDTVACLVNGLGATPREELYILYRRSRQLLDERGIQVHRTWIGEYATSLEMAGASVSLMKLDGELTRLVDAPADSPFIVQR